MLILVSSVTTVNLLTKMLPSVTLAPSLLSRQGVCGGPSACGTPPADGLPAPRLGSGSLRGLLPDQGGHARPEPLPLGPSQHRPLQPGRQGKTKHYWTPKNKMKRRRKFG